MKVELYIFMLNHKLREYLLHFLHFEEGHVVIVYKAQREGLEIKGKY